MQKNNTKNMILAAFFVAVAIILARFFSLVLMGGVLRLSFTNIPIVLASTLLGPFYGVMVGVLADVIGAIVFPQGPPFYGYTLSAAVIGFIPWLIIKGKKDFTFNKILLVNFLIFMVVSVGMNTYWSSMLSGKAFMVLLPPRALSGLVMMVINSFIIYNVGKRIRV